METRTFSIAEVIRIGWETFRKYPLFFILAAVITVARGYLPSQNPLKEISGKRGAVELWCFETPAC